MPGTEGTDPVYAALGDSISIDDYAGGPGRGGASLLARNVADDFPEWVGQDLETRLPGLRWRVMATDGATTATVLERQLPELRAADVRPSIITLTIGGNDVLSAYGDTAAAMRAIDVVRSRVGEILTILRATAAPDASVVVGTVYDPSDGTGDATRVGLPSWPEVVEVLAALNATLRTVASRHGARVAEIHELFLGHGLDRGNPAQGSARPPDRNLWYCNVIEPNAWGADGVRSAFWTALTEGT